MSNRVLLALALGLLLMAAPMARGNDNDGYYDDEEEDESAGDDDVLVLGTQNFDEQIAKTKFALVEFYAPWCGHCKNLAPHYAKAATELKASHPDVVVAKVDATEHADLGSRFNVQGYPSLKWFIDGAYAMDYGGGQDAEGIISWIKKKTGPFATTVESADEMKGLEADNQVLIMAYYKAFEGAAYDTFKSVATKAEGVTFVQTTSADAAKVAGLTAEGVASIKNFDGEERGTAIAPSSDSPDALKEFIMAEKMPLVLEFTAASSEKIFNSGIPMQIIYWASPSDLADESSNFKALKEVAATLRGKLVFVTSNSESKDAEPITKYFGLEGKPSPVVLGFHMEANKKFRMTSDVSTESLKAFAESVLDGTATPDYKSAEVPAKPTEDEVTVVVGKTFESIVLDETRDVMLEVYAPWCGHCKSLAPIYTKLAKRFRTVDSVVIAKMDGTENEHALVEAKGYPTILFFPAGSDSPITFEGGDRTLKSLTKFIKQHAKIEYELPKKVEKKDVDGNEDKDEL